MRKGLPGYKSAIRLLLILAPLLLPVKGAAEEVRIRRIHIQNLGVFDPQYSEFDAWYFRWADRLHVKTRKSFVRRELLFREGELLDTDLLEESERTLRRNAFLSSADIDISPVNESEADLIVRTEDQWTLELSLSYGTSAGSRTYDFGFEDVNFLGWGRKVGLKSEKNEERTAWIAQFSEPRLLRSRIRLDAKYMDASDGHLHELGMALPFFSEESHWSFRLRGQNLKKDEHLYFDGTDVAIQELNLFASSWQLEHAWGEPYRKTLAGLHVGFDEKIYPDEAVILDPDYASENEILENLNPPDRRFLQYGLTAGLNHENYVELKYIDYYGAVEDLPDGWAVNTVLLRAENGEGPDYYSFGLGGRICRPIADSGYYVVFADGGLRRQADDWNNKFLNLGFRLYKQHGTAHFGFFRSPHQTFAIGLTSTLTNGVDAPFQLSLGESEGLRGYNFKSFVGSSRVLLNVEHRIFTPFENRVLGLAVVPFFDAGATGGGTTSWSGGLSTGIGFRLGIKKLRRNHIIRIDLAWPLVNSPNKRFSVSVTTGQVFRAL